MGKLGDCEVTVPHEYFSCACGSLQAKETHLVLEFK